MNTHEPSKVLFAEQLLDDNALLPGNILPRSFDVEPTNEFFAERCGRDSIAAPPSPIREDIWWNTEGKAQWEQLQLEAEIAHQKAIEAYRRQVADTEEENQWIDEENSIKRQRYKNATSAYPRAMVEHQQAMKRLKAEVRQDLSDMLATQDRVIHAGIAHSQK